MNATSDTSVLYTHSGKTAFASRLSCRARASIYEFFMRSLAPAPEDTILDIGATCDQRYRESNFFERLYPYKNRITCVGAEDASHLCDLGRRHFEHEARRQLAE